MGRSTAVAAMAALLLTACAGNGGGTVGDEAEEATATEQPTDDADTSTVQDDDPDGEPADHDADEGAPDADDEGSEPASATVDLTTDPVDGCTELAGFVEVDATALSDALIATLVEPGGAFRADADLNPLTKAVLALEANEGTLPRVRYHLRYATMQRDVSGPGGTQVDLVRIDRFNLGPAIHAELADDLGTDAVADLDTFGVGPHVSYCFQMQTIQGMTADIFEAARAEYGDDAVGSTCLGEGCLTTAPIPDVVTDWEDTGEVGRNLTPVYDPLRDGVWSPAAALDLALVEAGVAVEDGGLTSWSGFEHREGLAPGEPFVEVVIDAGLGQDSSVDLALREGHVMDHTMEAVWQRIMAVHSGLPEDPLTFGAMAIEERTAG